MRNRVTGAARAVISVQILKGVAGEEVFVCAERVHHWRWQIELFAPTGERKEREGKNNIRPDQVSVISSYTVVTRSLFTCLTQRFDPIRLRREYIYIFVNENLYREISRKNQQIERLIFRKLVKKKIWKILKSLEKFYS